MPTQQEIEEAMRNAQVVDLKNNKLEVNNTSLWSSKKNPIKVSGEFTALRDIEIDFSQIDPQLDGGFDWTKIGEYMKNDNDIIPRTNQIFPKKQSWRVKKGETFNSDLIPERRYLKDGYLLKFGEKLYLGKDIEFTSKVKSQQLNNQDSNSSSNGAISISKEQLPWLILGVVALILVLKN